MSTDIESVTSELDTPWPRVEPQELVYWGASRVYTVLIPYRTKDGTHFRRVTLPLLSIQRTRQ